MKKNRKFILWFWIATITLIWSVYLIYPESFTQEKFADFLNQFQWFVILLYLFVFSLRGFFFIPSTVLILTGTILFPPYLLIILASIWNLTSSSLVYFFSDFLWVRKEARWQFWKEKMKNLENKLKQHAFSYITIWSIIPIVPTDIICAISGISRVKYRTFVLAIFLWGLPLIATYAFLWEWLLEVLF
jgi:uncharacterized membrane protein YdjX (TVP38/TMEM64 family)